MTCGTQRNPIFFWQHCFFTANMARADMRYGTSNFTDEFDTSSQIDMARRVLAAIETRCPRATESEIAAFAKLTTIFNDDTDCYCYFTLCMLPFAMRKAFRTLESGTVASLIFNFNNLILQTSESGTVARPIFNFHNFILLTHTNIKADAKANANPWIRLMPYRYLSLIHDVLQRESIGQEYGLENHADSEASMVPFPILYHARS